MDFAEQKKYRQLKEENQLLLHSGAASRITARCGARVGTKRRKETVFSTDLLEHYIRSAEELISEATGPDKPTVQCLTFLVRIGDGCVVPAFKKHWEARGVFCLVEACRLDCARHARIHIQMYPTYETVNGAVQ